MTINRLVKGRGAEPVHVYESKPSEPGPGLIIVPSIFGIGPDVIEHADGLAAQGALVWVLDPFWRTAPGPLTVGVQAPEAMARKRAHAEQAGHDDVTDLLAAIRQERLCCGRTLTLGICFGGRFSFLAAARGLVDGCAAWHGGGLGSLLDRAADIRVPTSLHFGDADPLIPIAEVDEIRAAFSEHEGVEIGLHPGAGHGFTHTGALPYNAAATRSAVAGIVRLIGQLKDEALAHTGG